MDKPRILIVDDDLNLCKSMSLVLRRRGYTVTTVNDGPDAIEKVKKSPFDMIFLDIKMPMMNGVETYKTIKQIRPEADVTMITAYVSDDLVQDVLQAGATGILYKPFDIDRVIRSIDEVLGRTESKKP
jgi:two-component system response regulator HydG